MENTTQTLADFCVQTNYDKIPTEVVERKHGVPVISIVDITDVLEFLMARPELRKWCDAVASYRDTYGL